ncbi:RPEL repeat protein [Phyllosticta citricarpa]|uniref:RPEL repeat protein n=3 Tax=Phyllosticta TaxID=121621 RepID=A0ABR1MGU5_9PEZI
MATESETPIVDTTSIAPVRAGAERRNSLEKHLQQRPDAQDLKNRHILLDTNAAPALQQKQLELERQQISDSLKKGIAHRPDRETLVQRHILPDSTAAPALQAHQLELEHNMRADKLENALKSRPKPEDLVEKGILTADEKPVSA